jgi:hypothetical protein
LGFNNSASALENCVGDTNSTEITVMQARQRLQLEPNVATESSFVVKNTGCADYDFSVSVTPYAPDKNYDNAFDIENKWTQIARYIDLPQSEFRLAAGDSVAVPFVVNTPGNDLIAGGGQYAAIAVTVRGGGDGGVNVTKRVMYQIYGRVAGDIVENGSVVEWQVPRWVSSSNSLATQYQVRNGGNVDFTAVGGLRVSGLFGGVVYETPGRERISTFAFPETEPPVAEVFWDNARWGVFWVEQDVDIFGDVVVNKQLVLIAPVWLVVVASIGILALLFLAIYNVWRRLRRSKTKRKGRK